MNANSSTERGERYLDVRELAEVLGISVRKTRELSSGKRAVITPIRLPGRTIRFDLRLVRYQLAKLNRVPDSVFVAANATALEEVRR
jgi:hypothetical protein